MANIHSKVSEEEAGDKQSGGGTDQCQTNTSACQLKSQEEDPQSSQPENGNIFVPHSDSELGLKLLNGQMCVEVSNWKCKFPSVIMKNHVCANPKGGLEVAFCNEVIKIEFRIPPRFPDRMIGFMTVLQSLFLEPERLGITEIKIGSELVKQECHKAKDQECHVNWSSPRDRSGCRVSWIKENDDSMIKYKFSNINKIGVDEEMIMEVNGSNEMYGKISSADPVSVHPGLIQWTCLLTTQRLRTANGSQCQHESGFGHNGSCAISRESKTTFSASCSSPLQRSRQSKSKPWAKP